MSGSGIALNNPKRNFALVGLVILVIPELVNSPWAIYLTKPLACIFLLVFSLSNYEEARTRNLLLGGILFSLLGDTILMFPGELVFLVGLGSFLIAQILYTVTFFRLGSKPFGSVVTKLWLLTILLYLLLFMFYLKELVGDMFVPILFYALAISLMLSMAIGLKNVIGKRPWAFIVLGAAFFVLSDSLLAIDKFAQPLPINRLLIMSTYLIAQFGIVFGLVEGQEKS